MQTYRIIDFYLKHISQEVISKEDYVETIYMYNTAFFEALIYYLDPEVYKTKIMVRENTYPVNNWIQVRTDDELKLVFMEGEKPIMMKEFKLIIGLK